MTTPILATKLYIPPPRPKLVLRQRLIDRLNAGLQGRLTLISAPAGFGKTTLVSDWIAAGGRAAAWLSLDEGDNDPTRFWTYVINAVRLAAPTAGDGALNLLQSLQPPPIEAILTVLVNEISAQPDPFLLVLDDYHLIDSKSIDSALAFLIKHLPPQLHLVIATREDPELPLARLRARGELSELRITDLRFTANEAAAFLNQVMGLQLAASDIRALEDRTEGWIAGLQLAALALQGANAMQGAQQSGRFIEAFTGSHHFVMDYLVEEILQQQPESVQTFLLHTSILNKLCGSLCDQVLQTEARSGQETLEAIDQANLFVIPLDSERHWYRYHHLFADVLRARLVKERTNQVTELHQRASAWYEHHQLLPDAVHHALAARDFEHAADLIEVVRLELSTKGFISSTWQGWFKTLPDALVRSRPRLCIGYSWEMLLSGDMEAAVEWMNQTERSLTSASLSDEMRRSVGVSLTMARAFYAQAHGDSSVIAHGERALTLIGETDYHERGIILALLGLAYWTRGDLEAAYRSSAAGMESMLMSGNVVFALSGAHMLGDIRMAQGRLRDAISGYEGWMQLAMTQDKPAGMADLHLELGLLRLEQGDDEAAQQHLQKSIELGEQAGLPDWKLHLYVTQARMKLALGDFDGTLELLDKAERMHHRSPLPDIRPITAIRARVWIAQGKLAEARGWARGRGLSVDDDLSYVREYEYLTLARLLLAGSGEDITQALRLLDRLLSAAEAGERMGSVLEILILQSLAWQAQHDIDAAMTVLARALSLAESEGYVQMFISEGAPMADLLREAAARGIMAEYAGQLITAFGTKPETRKQGLIEPLSQRELEVLGLIAQGLSNQEIAERLYLALITVKGHNQKIFGKLQVQRRTEAVARARELGLI